MALCIVGGMKEAPKDPASLAASMEMIAYLSNLAVRCDKIARNSREPHVRETLGAISVELIEKTAAREALNRDLYGLNLNCYSDFSIPPL
jgi:hypothetical protein